MKLADIRGKRVMHELARRCRVDALRLNEGAAPHARTDSAEYPVQLAVEVTMMEEKAARP